MHLHQRGELLMRLRQTGALDQLQPRAGISLESRMALRTMQHFLGDGPGATFTQLQQLST